MDGRESEDPLGDDGRERDSWGESEKRVGGRREKESERALNPDAGRRTKH